MAFPLTLLLASCLSMPTAPAIAQIAEQAGPTNVPAITGLPDQGFTAVEEHGTLSEDWGSVALRLEVEGHRASPFEPLPPEAEYAPVVRARTRCGPCELRTVIFRAPTYPNASDVVRATVVNRGQEPTSAALVVDHSATGPDFALSPEALSAGSRRLIGLPAYAEPTLPMNDWGLAGNAGPIPGWARPNEPCDPAFRNISVGWRGDPITYRFKVEPNGGRLVVLGICESHWAEPDNRPLILQVEGAPDMRVDPIGDWGQHVPKCLAFQAKDASGDGWLTVTSITPTDAADRNSILNVIWIFPAGAAEDIDAVKRGERSAGAEYYVDVGGERDQSLYTVGDIPYPLELQAGEERTLTFVVASRGGPAPEGPETPVEADRLLANAEGLWREWLGEGARISIPDPEAMAAWNASLAAIVMVRGQASKYLIPRPSTDPNSFSYQAAGDITRALDLSGHHRDAEACLLMLWDRPLPEPIAKWGQAQDGSWRLSDDDYCSHGRVMVTLARHYFATGDRAWLARAYPSVKKGVEWLETTLAEHDGLLPIPQGRKRSAADPNEWAAAGLAHARELATAMGAHEDKARVSVALRRLQTRMAGLPIALFDQLDWEEPADLPPRAAETVPFSHWAYEAVQKLVNQGVIIGYTDRHEFRGEREMTRYEFAMAIVRLMEWRGVVEPLSGPVVSDSEIRALCAKPELTETDILALCAKLLDEFKVELAYLTAQIAEVPADLDQLEPRYGSGTAAAERLRALLAETSPQGFFASRFDPDTRQAQGAFPDAARGAQYVRYLRNMLLQDRPNQTALLRLAPAEWLTGQGGVVVERAPTDFGPISFRARIVGGALKLAITPPPRLPASIRVDTFASEARKPARVRVDGKGWRAEMIDGGGAVALSPSESAVTVTVEYE